MDELRPLIASPEFDPESALVVLDFMFRHGVLDPSTQPLYEVLWTRLHPTMIDFDEL
jgi:hypothetical protein